MPCIARHYGSITPLEVSPAGIHAGAGRVVITPLKEFLLLKLILGRTTHIAIHRSTPSCPIQSLTNQSDTSFSLSFDHTLEARTP